MIVEATKLYLSSLHYLLHFLHLHSQLLSLTHRIAASNGKTVGGRSLIYIYVLSNFACELHRRRIIQILFRRFMTKLQCNPMLYWCYLLYQYCCSILVSGPNTEKNGFSARKSRHCFTSLVVDSIFC